MSKEKSIKGKVQIKTYDDILQSSHGEQIIQSSGNAMDKPNGNEVVIIPIEQLQAFKDHPFSVVDDNEMEELVESIRSKGVVSPIIVRQLADNQFEIISGHRRKRACELAGIKDIPAIVKELDDIEAVMQMVDSNLHRENIRPMERARAFTMRMEAEKKQSGRKGKNSGQVVHNLTADIIGKDNGISGRQVRRFAHLTYLIPEFQKMVDENKIPFTTAVDLSFISEKEQKWILDAILQSGKSISTKQMKDIDELRKFSELTEREVSRIISGMPSVKRNVTLTDKELKQYFPEDMDANHIKEIILEMLKRQSTGGNGDAE